MEFFISYEDILERIDCIDPIKYSKTRNHKDGAISYLSPFISRGVISTQFVYKRLLANGFKFWQAEKFIQELAWRDYWQQIWIAKGDLINQDLKHPQQKVSHQKIPVNITEANTSIIAVDYGIENLYRTGYMHNHMRMYVAAITCNIAQSYWKTPAHWMYYHLLDGDWASNALSWQWVAGANANKKYYANQNNINTFFNTSQKNTFIDVDYDVIEEVGIPKELLETTKPSLTNHLPISDDFEIDRKLPVLIYNYYNLDPNWKTDTEANRILLLEPKLFEQYLVSKNCIDFVLHLKSNIPNINIFVGSFDELKTQCSQEQEVFYKEHPLNHHYKGIEEPRDWMFNVQGYFPSFFSYWKKCKKELKLK
ncbi:FAD-binding domain-containing protein [Wenyingzhuangia sp. IMCC45533]